MISRRIGGEVVLVPTGAPVGDSANFYVLNDSGQVLWDELKVPRSADELARALVNCYSIEYAAALADVDRFLAELRSCGALHTELPRENT